MMESIRAAHEVGDTKCEVWRRVWWCTELATRDIWSKLSPLSTKIKEAQVEAQRKTIQ